MYVIKCTPFSWSTGSVGSFLYVQSHLLKVPECYLLFISSPHSNSSTSCVCLFLTLKCFLSRSPHRWLPLTIKSLTWKPLATCNYLNINRLRLNKNQWFSSFVIVATLKVLSGYKEPMATLSMQTQCIPEYSVLVWATATICMTSTYHLAISQKYFP